MYAFPLLVAIAASISMAASAAQTGDLVWSDEFNTGVSPNPTYWGYDYGDGTFYRLDSGWGNGELQYYTQDRSNVLVENGYLKIKAQQDDKYERYGASFTSARIKTEDKMAFTYGTLEARIKTTDVTGGLWPAFWIMGDGYTVREWPERGEVDIMELGWKGQGNKVVYSAAHWENDGKYAVHDGKFTASADLSDDFHVYKLEWTPTAMTTYIDGNKMWEFDISQGVGKCEDCEEFHHAHSIRLSLAVGGGFTTSTDSCGGSSAGGSSAAGSSGGCLFRTAAEVTAAFPGEMWVDYVRVYANEHTQMKYAVKKPPTPAPVRKPTAAPVLAQLTPKPVSTAPITPPPLARAAPTDKPAMVPATAAPVMAQKTPKPVQAQPLPAPTRPTRPPVRTLSPARTVTGAPVMLQPYPVGTGPTTEGNKNKNGGNKGNKANSEGGSKTSGGKSSGKSGGKSTSGKSGTKGGDRKEAGSKETSRKSAKEKGSSNKAKDRKSPKYSSVTNQEGLGSSANIVAASFGIISALVMLVL